MTFDRTSVPWSAVDAAYDVIVVGSGYGGGAVALRMAESGRRVLVLERGRERVPGEFPTGVVSALRQVRVATPTRAVGRSDALFDVTVSDDVVVLTGNGLGGGSLVNAGVMLPPTARAMSDPSWPVALQGGTDPSFTEALAHARAVLQPTPVPAEVPLAKRAAMQRVAAHLGATAEAVPVAVRFTSDERGPGCTMCGDCISGCNVGAKRTVALTYLTLARASGARLVADAEVHHVRRAPDGSWEVVVHHGGTAHTVRASTVVLAAGALGSTGILLRSREQGLALSPMLGHRVSGNGDFLGYAYDGAADVNAVGVGARHYLSRRVGPTITTMVNLTEGKPDDDVLVQDGTIPSPLAPLMPLGLLAASWAAARGPHRKLGRVLRQLASIARTPRKGPVAHTLTFLAMGHDTAEGTIVLDREGRPVVRWRDGAGGQWMTRADAAFDEAAKALKATYLRAPTWKSPLGNFYLTVHPLGGCAMADDAARGVVDGVGRVYAGTHGTEVHEGLWVADGSVVPAALGRNPALTIAALAERTAAAMADSLPAPGTPAPTPPPPGVDPDRPGLRFHERLSGARTRVRGLAGTHPMAIELDIVVDDLELLLADPARAARATGTVTIGGLLDGPATAAGTFRLFVPDPAQVDTARMHYDLTWTDAGSTYRVVGRKRIHDDEGADLLADTTRLACFVYRDDELVAAGRLHIGVRGLVSMVRSMHVERAAGRRRRIVLHARFLLRFLRALTGVYGGALHASSDWADINRPVTSTRPLRAPVGETSWYDPRAGAWVTDGPMPEHAELQLVRHRGGVKGPVLLAPGFAMNASSFAPTTIDENLVEHLCARGYDVWLFDYRGGIHLPASKTDFTLDDIARTDWPRAVDRVRAVTGADSVQVIGHCVGSMSALMAVLSGTQGVRSMVCSQVTVHVDMPRFSRAKAHLRLATVLHAIGCDTIDPQQLPRWRDRLLDLTVLRVNPALKGERCRNPICRWVFWYFGPTHRHANLDAATHQALAHQFDRASLKAMQHLSRIVRHGKAVSNDGDEDAYLSHPERLAIPVTFLVGDRNNIFRPPGAKKTAAWLAEHNGPDLYEVIELDGYAHLDGLVGVHAARDVYPHIMAALENAPD